jgi:hypothetical protein
MSKYDIGVGEAFPLDESQPQDERGKCCGRHSREHHGHHRHTHYRHSGAHLAAVTLLFTLAAHHGARMARHGEEH